MKTLLLTSLSLFAASIIGFLQGSADDHHISVTLIVTTMGGAIAALAGYIVLLIRERIKADRIHAERVERIVAQHVVTVQDISDKQALRYEKIIEDNREMFQEFGRSVTSLREAILTMK